MSPVVAELAGPHQGGTEGQQALLVAVGPAFVASEHLFRVATPDLEVGGQPVGQARLDGLGHPVTAGDEAIDLPVDQGRLHCQGREGDPGHLAIGIDASAG